MKRKLRLILMGLLLVAVVLGCTSPGSSGGGSATLPIDYPPNSGGGDNLTRAFYIKAYPGTTLSTVTLYFCAETTNTYTIQLKALDSAFNGTQIGLTTADFTGTGSSSNISDEVATIFDFGIAPVTKGHVVAFIISLVSGIGNVWFCVDGVTTGTPIVEETQDSTPPLSTKRRAGIAIKVEGQN